MTDHPKWNSKARLKKLLKPISHLDDDAMSEYSCAVDPESFNWDERVWWQEQPEASEIRRKWATAKKR